jgi:hypothetical protein
MKHLFLLSSLLLINCTFAFAQKWQPGYFLDIKGNKVIGLIQPNPSGKGPIKNEGFIAFKDDAKAKEMKLSASDMRYFVAGQDSFIVAHAPNNEAWAKVELDFVKVELDEPLKLYVYRGSSSGGGGFRLSPSFGGSIGGGGYAGGGVGISLGGGGGSGGGRSGTLYYFGEKTTEMSLLTPENFSDVMSDIMADEPQAVEAIQSGKYRYNKLPALIDFYKKLKAAH